MPWAKTSAATKTFPAASWERLAQLDERSPGKTSIPPSKLISSQELEAVRDLVLQRCFVEFTRALADSGVGSRKRNLVMRKWLSQYQRRIGDTPDDIHSLGDFTEIVGRSGAARQGCRR